MIKKLDPKQKKQHRQAGTIPPDWWNYGINPILGYRNYQLVKPKVVENSQPVPKAVRNET